MKLSDFCICDCFKTKYNDFCDFLKLHCLELTICLFIFACIITILFSINGDWAFEGIWIFLAASLAAIFPALKYKLDQANYQRELFEKRYKIFSIINDILKDYTKNNNAVTSEMNDKMSVDLMRESIFLFNDETYKFLDEFRVQLCRRYRSSNAMNNNQATQGDIDDNYYASLFISKYVDAKNLASKFPEMKISFY